MVIQKLSGPERGRSHELKQGDNRIGRAQDNDIVVLDRTVSSSHLTLTLAGDAVTARDHSKNGTFVNDQRIAEATLSTGDRIRIGMTELQLLAQPATEDEPTVVATSEDRTEPRKVGSRPSPVASARRAASHEDSGPYKKTSQPAPSAGAAPSRPAEDAKPKQRPNKARRLLLVSGAVLVTMIVAMVLMENPPSCNRDGGGGGGGGGSTTPIRDDGMIVVVLTEFAGINLAAYPPEVKGALENGANFYRKGSVPGNRYNALDQWREVRSKLSGDDARRLANCIYTVADEMADKFTQDSGKVETLLMQEPRDVPSLLVLLDDLSMEFPGADDRRGRWVRRLLARHDKPGAR